MLVADRLMGTSMPALPSIHLHAVTHATAAARPPPLKRPLPKSGFGGYTTVPSGTPLQFAQHPLHRPRGFQRLFHGIQVASLDPFEVTAGRATRGVQSGLTDFLRVRPGDEPDRHRHAAGEPRAERMRQGLVDL